MFKKKNYRVLIVEFIDLVELQQFYKHEFSLKNEFLRYNIRINYRLSSRNKIILVDYDGTNIYITDRFTYNGINKIFSILSSRNKIKTNINKNNKYHLLCNLPHVKEKTEHCFNDSTHHTCCLLGRRARNYSNFSGNSIGKISEQMFEQYYGRPPLKNDLTPWCTCIGSKVCNYYSNLFNNNANKKNKDGTHIKFINNNGTIIHNLVNKPGCESNIVNDNNFFKHSTPGIGYTESINDKCYKNSFII